MSKSQNIGFTHWNVSIQRDSYENAFKRGTNDITMGKYESLRGRKAEYKVCAAVVYISLKAGRKYVRMLAGTASGAMNTGVLCGGGGFSFCPSVLQVLPL